MWRVGLVLLPAVGCAQVFGLDTPDPIGDPCTGVCECKTDAECGGAHEVCVDAVTERTCECAAGYTDKGAGCVWSGVVADPQIQTSNTWSLDSGVSLSMPITVGGMLDPGTAQVMFDQQCTPAGVSQMIEIPRLSRAEPLVVLASYDNTRLGGGGANGEVRPLIGIGAQWSETAFALMRNQSFVHQRVCLGEAFYAPESSTGRGVSVPFAAPASDTFCEQGTKADMPGIDHVEILPAMPDECPAAGTVPNGDAEGDGGWKLTMTGSGVAAFLANVGEGNSRGVRLAITQRCDNANAAVPVGIPSAASAVSLFHALSGNPRVTVTLGEAALPVSTAAQGTIDRFCVPAPLRGEVADLEVAVTGPSGSLCSDTTGGSFVVDSVRIAAEPACGSDEGVADPGFESGLALLGVAEQAGKSSVDAQADNTAHSGIHALHLAVSDGCASASYTPALVTPATANGAGPALTFWYKLGAGSAALTVTPMPSLSMSSFTPVRDNQWHQAIVCLAKIAAGRSQSVGFRWNTAVTCGAIQTETALVDDLEVTTDASCQ